MSIITAWASDPRTYPALLGLIVALTAALRANAAATDAHHALKRLGGRRTTPQNGTNPPPGQQERRKP